MHYFGGKFRTRKQIAEYLESVRDGRPYLEPFVGGACVLQELTGVREASDGCEALITLYKALQGGWEPPTVVTEAMYKEYQAKKDHTDPMTAFVGFGCSFSGKWFGGYAKDNTGRNYALNAKNSLMCKIAKLQDVIFTHTLYQDLNPKGYLIYCDPPYQSTTLYGAVGTFDHDEFWDIMRKWSKDNIVVISEYQAPEDFTCVLAMPTHTSIRDKNNDTVKTVEKLFIEGALHHV